MRWRDDGIDAVRVEPLAKALAVTKGSFYWHFADRRALIDAMLAQWTEARRGDPRAGRRPRRPGRDPARLADLYTRHGNVRGLAIELAIRARAQRRGRGQGGTRGGQRAPEACGGCSSGSAGRARDAKARAVLFYSYLFGQSLLDPKLVTAVPPSTAAARARRPALAEPAGSAVRPHVSNLTLKPNHSVAIPRNEKKPTTSVTVVTNGPDATAGSTPEPVQRERNQDPAERRRHQLADHRQPDHDAEVGHLEPRQAATPGDHGETRCR